MAKKESERSVTLRRIESEVILQLEAHGSAYLELDLNQAAIIMSDLIGNLFVENGATIKKFPVVILKAGQKNNLCFTCHTEIDQPIPAVILFAGSLINGVNGIPKLLNNRLNISISNQLTSLGFYAGGFDKVSKNVLNDLPSAIAKILNNRLHLMGHCLRIGEIKLTISNDQILVDIT